MKNIFLSLTLLGAYYVSAATYTIRRGDTLHDISQRNGYDLETVKGLNPGIIPEELQPGQFINVPDDNRGASTPSIPGSGSASEGTYVIQKGETIYDISVRYGYNWKEVEDMNRHLDVKLLQPGQEIRVPRSGHSSSGSSSPKSTTSKEDDLNSW